MKSFKSTSTFASVVYLLPVLLLCGAAAMYFLYQGKLESADAAREQAIEAEADSQVTAVNSQVRQLRAEIIETGELLLRQLPLPLSGDPEIVLRELNQDMASRETAWGELFIVSLDSNARQFYYDAREFQTGLLDLVSQGERAGPRAFRTADGFELFIAEPLSNPDWVAVARISRSGLSGPLATGLGDVGQVTIEQVIGETDAMTLFTFGGTPAGSELSRTPSVQGWRLTFAPSQAFLDRHSSSATGPFILVLVFGLGFVLSLAFAGWTYSRQGKEPLTAPSTQTKESDEPKSKKEKAGLIGKLSGKKSEPVEEELDPLEEEADDPQAEFETDVDDDFTPLTAEQLPAKIFRANDIRGLAGEQITESFARHLGRCFAMMAKESGADKVFIGRDPRNDSEALSEALSQGISESGCDVVNVGLCATPVLAWAMQSQDATAAVMVTASHNPSEYNGFKLILDGTTLQSEGIRKLRES